VIFEKLYLGMDSDSVKLYLYRRKPDT
jgi:hypothetical protein